MRRVTQLLQAMGARFEELGRGDGLPLHHDEREPDLVGRVEAHHLDEAEPFVQAHVVVARGLQPRERAGAIALVEDRLQQRRREPLAAPIGTGADGAEVPARHERLERVRQLVAQPHPLDVDQRALGRLDVGDERRIGGLSSTS